jgi:acetyl-CoA synthetase
MSNQDATILGELLPYEEKIGEAGDFTFVDVKEYIEAYKKTLDNYENFWEEIALELDWFKNPQKVLESGEKPYIYKWFSGGLINISYLALDKHVKSIRKNKIAYIWEGEPVDKDGNPKEIRKLTYYDLWREVNRSAYILKSKFGLKKGDKVGIYLPMIPELPIFMLAAARIGIIFTVVFAGFTAENLATRLNDIKATLLITADGFYRRGKIIRLKDIADKALALSPSVKNVIVVRRLGFEDLNMVQGRDYFFDELSKNVDPGVYVEPEKLESNETLYVLYTSGTTGKPKGIMHDHGGYSVLLHATMKWVFDIKDEDIHFCTADIGWVTGHSYIVFGPLIEGATSIMYEGAPDFPHPDRIWSIVERYGATILYTSPTLVRMLMKFGENWVKKHDRSTLRIIHSVGEPINPAAWRWLYEVVGERRCPVGSTWWMTETGGIMISHTPGFKLVHLKPGTNALPLPGIDVDVVDEKGNSMEPGKKGFLVIRRPWPGMPSWPDGIWEDYQRYVQVYWDKIKGLFFTGDWAIRDQDGYIWVLGRADEVLKVAGHRIGTYELESTLVSHKAVAESAVVGYPDEIKGEVPVAFVSLKAGFSPSVELEEELKGWIRREFGPIAVPSQIFFVSRLPKTRSGKIMRRLLRAVLENKPLGDITTLEDEAAVEEIKEAYEHISKEIKRT